MYFFGKRTWSEPEAGNGKNDLSPDGGARLRSASELLLVDKLDSSRRAGSSHDAWRNRLDLDGIKLASHRRTAFQLERIEVAFDRYRLRPR